MKALKLLKKYGGLINQYTMDLVSKDISEAIEELEALQNRSCSNCKHWELGWCFKLGSSLDIGGCGDYWEQK